MSVHAVSVKLAWRNILYTGYYDTDWVLDWIPWAAFTVSRSSS